MHLWFFPSTVQTWRWPVLYVLDDCLVKYSVRPVFTHLHTPHLHAQQLFCILWGNESCSCSCLTQRIPQRHGVLTMQGEAFRWSVRTCVWSSLGYQSWCPPPTPPSAPPLSLRHSPLLPYYLLKCDKTCTHTHTHTNTHTHTHTQAQSATLHTPPSPLKCIV